MQEMITPYVRWEWIGEGWQMFAEKWQVWVVQMLIVGAIFAIPVVPFYMMMLSMQMQVATNPNQPPTFSPFLLPLGFGIGLLSILGGAFFFSGFYKTAFKQLRGEQITVGDLFSGGEVFLRVIGAFIAIAFFALLGALLCILPAFVVGGVLYFTLPLIIEREMSIGEALRTSYEATKANWLMFTLFAFVVSLLASLGQFACYVGLVVTYPLQFTIAAIAYRDVFGVPGARSFTGSTQQQYPSNYAPQSFPPPPPPQFNEPARPEEPTTLICTNCGTMITRQARFCSKCGSPIGS
ncbi:MAG: zinc-ribbon domain-containing protein [Acidobacteria bacterium]|nr:zinc-ribbon domain-containing protein [Acidobacteriota bacterium]